MKRLIQLLTFIVFISGLHNESLQAQQHRTSGNYPFETECLGSEMDGSITLKAWGNGRNRLDAVSQAKKNAVRDVMFTGITKGRQGCNPRPLVPEVNADLKYENYFNAFFSDRKGDYKKFVSGKDERIEEKLFRQKMGARHGVTYSVVVRVHRAELRNKLITDGILQE